MKQNRRLQKLEAGATGNDFGIIKDSAKLLQELRSGKPSGEPDANFNPHHPLTIETRLLLEELRLV